MDRGQALRIFARTTWQIGRVPICLALAVIAAFLTGYLAWFSVAWLYEKTIVLYRAMDTLVQGSDSAIGDSFDRGKLFAGLAVGAAVVVTWFKDLMQKVTDLHPWQNAEAKAIRAACVALFASALGFFISVFAAQQPADSKSPTVLAFDGLSVPPTQVLANDGIVAFYIPFYTEASWGALVNAEDSSIAVSGGFETFLRTLGRTLRNCASAQNPMTVTVSGFASNTKWHAFESDTDPSHSDYVRQAIAITLQTKDAQTLDLHLQSLRGVRAEIEKLASKEFDSQGYISPSAWPDAFNVWVANTRREAVIRELGIDGLDPVISINRVRWTKSEDMRQALALNDSFGSPGQWVGGIMTRSVRISVANVGSCQRSSVAQSTYLTLSH